MPGPIGDVDIANLALIRIGYPQQLNSFNDGSEAAALLSKWYYNLRDMLLRDFPWPWAKASAVLAQVSTAGQMATPEWLYSYRYPTDCLWLRRLFANPQAIGIVPPLTTIPNQQSYTPQPWLRADGDPTPPAFDIAADTAGKLILTDMPNAVAIYTRSVTDPTQFPQDFVSLLAWRVATDMAYALAISDARRKEAFDAYQFEMNKAKANALNEQQSDTPTMEYQSPTVQARFAR